MHFFTEFATAFRKAYFGGNWCGVSLQEIMADVTWEEAVLPVAEFNSLAALLYHVHYYVHGVQPVLQGGSLDIRDKFSFEVPPVQSAADWDALKAKVWAEAETFLHVLASLPDDQLAAPFSEPKYGIFYHNLQGILEHVYYHLGQMVLLKRLLRQRNGLSS